MRTKALVAGLIAVALGATVLTLRADARPGGPTCESVIATFQARFPEIAEEAGHPTTSCVASPDAGVGAYTADNHIEINTVLSAQALDAGYTDLRGYWRRGIAHEFGHSWGAHNGFDPAIYTAIRGIAVSDTLGEDYAETFAYSLGWMMDDCYGAAPYCFNGTGTPTKRQIVQLRAAGQLPY